MNIRLERPEDYCEVENLTREAFWNVYRPGCLEHFVLNQYRTNPDFVADLDFVMEEDGKIIGHVMYSKAEIVLDNGEIFPSWTFGPISRFLIIIIQNSQLNNIINNLCIKRILLKSFSNKISSFFTISISIFTQSIATNYFMIFSIR